MSIDFGNEFMKIAIVKVSTICRHFSLDTYYIYICKVILSLSVLTACLLKQRMMEMVVTTGAISHAKLQSYHHQQTNIQFFTGRMPFLSPNQQCQNTKGKISHSMDLLIPSSPGGLPTLFLTTNSSWLPWGRVAMPLISPLMPVPQHL